MPLFELDFVVFVRLQLSKVEVKFKGLQRRGDIPHELSMNLVIEMKSTFNKLVAAPFGRTSVALRGTVWSGTAAQSTVH